MQRCLLISFDFWKENYPKISYSIASILARFKNSNNIELTHHSFNLKDLIGKEKEFIEEHIISEYNKYFAQSINNFDFIAISAYSWSENLVNVLINNIRDVYKGKIILGGYEITALSESDLQRIYPRVDHFIKGYAENSLEKLFCNITTDLIIENQLNENDLISPYLSGIFAERTDKIHWESKRGCPYTCGFCEWGNAAKKKVYKIDDNRLKKEIEYFKELNVKEINVIDATFLITDRDNTILEWLLEIPYCKITLQVRFEILDSKVGEKFLHLCKDNRDRINLEFGLQTIHESEMKAINRINDLGKIENVIWKLNQYRIDYLISIIFGIPGQTVDSFDQTIEFIKKNGCTKYIAFPLQIPKNSELCRKKDEYEIEEKEGESFSLSFVNKSYSFSKTDWESMCKKTGQPFIGDPFEKKQPFFDIYFDRPSKFIIMKRFGFKYLFQKEAEFMDLIFESNGEKKEIYRMNTIQFKNTFKYQYFEGNIYNLITNEKYSVELADSGNVYLLE
jgi:radical SAM superfamily enzyme YgiQ (UPF0313 family)